VDKTELSLSQEDGLFVSFSAIGAISESTLSALKALKIVVLVVNMTMGYLQV